MTYDAAPDPRHKHRSLMGSALAAAMVMAVGMGFARFAYTGVYPVMVSEGLLTVHDGTLAASANYAGYLLGALLASRLLTHQAHRWVIVSMVMSVVCLVYIAFAPSPLMIIVTTQSHHIPFGAWSLIAAYGLAGFGSDSRGAFMGTVTIALPAAKRVSHTIDFNLIAIMTAAYGIAQIVGPLLASYLYAQSGTFTFSLIATALGLVFSAALTVRIPTTD